ncbi:efflux RND transporter permease subunit [Mariniflexile litorale]|uniref:Efflux RND transporter permease subunit n=1 Tax=Mariniflexile litorale TaxID=3045158 RepID=A0AAU7EHI6_9FLAO|nr:efflux RND transporter permease subunit [Mariniflexile sp. KMM 9835]MDQ8209996.1 efflux RND transporter permease subunit [Mariniflexile sp. KMM 9835]
MNFKFSSFSILTVFICLSIIGASLIPLLSLQLAPSKTLPSIHVSFSWQDASAKVMEQEVTSKLEGVFNTVKGIKDISSTSYKGWGNIAIQFKKNSNMDALRFEIANLIRQSYPELPEGVSYPSLSLSAANENMVPILSYSIHANENPYYIKKYAETYISPQLSTLKGVNQVNIYGAVPFEWVIEYNTNTLLQLNMSVNDIQSAINVYLNEQELGSGMFRVNKEGYDHEIVLNLSYKPDTDINWAKIPIKKIGNRIVYLGNIATVTYKEANVTSYYRINGLNIINMTVYAEQGVNTIDLANSVKEKVDDLSKELDTGYSIKLTQDTTEFVVEELQKIQKRTLFSFLILLILILLINRSFKYLAILFLSIITNLLIAINFYYLFKVELQLYSFAGITISFGIIIDNSIIMIDHIRNKGNKKAFLAILAATLTTIGALMIIFLLEESQQADLFDFALVIAINIGVSLLVSLFYVPALLEKMNLSKKRVHFSRKRKRRIIRFTNLYSRLIFWMKKPRFKWAFILIFILGFGIPFQLLPKDIERDGFMANLYNKSIGAEWFANDLRPTLEKIIGGALRLFTEDVFENSYYSEPERTTLRVTGSMPDGCTIEQLNEAITKMESYLSQFDEIALFETRISSYRNSSISIYFKEDFEFSGFPYTLKSLLESKAISLGGLDWSVTGVGRGFSNALSTGYKQNRIVLEGYNYDKLYSYAEQLKQQLEASSNSRVREVEITSGGWQDNALYEYYLDFDANKLAFANVSQIQLYGYLKNQLHSGPLTSIIQNNELQDVKLVSDKYKKFNVWDLKNTPITIQNKQYKLNQLASIEKKKTGNTIEKQNQQYSLTVAYDFIGTAPLAQKVRERTIESFEPKLPLGYKVFEQKYSRWDKKDETQYYYLFIVIGIIFFICAILLESLKQPFAIISMIPISFIGVFLTFYLFDFNFDQGGYASFILLSGISVNSALYILNDFNNLRKDYPNRHLGTLYFKAFNYKITPVILTIVSTIVGLIPFVWSGQNEAFWFSFAVGSIGGLMFSLIGIFIYLPLFIVKSNQYRVESK